MMEFEYTLKPMSSAPKNEMILLDSGYGFLVAGYYNSLDKVWVCAIPNCNDNEGVGMYFENEYEKAPKGWLEIPLIKM